MLTLNEEEQFRGWVRQILEESAGELITEGPLTDTFVKPFQNVLNVAKVTLKDVLTVAKFNFDILTTFDPIKLQHLRQNFEERRANIKKDYAKAMEPVKKALNQDDVKLASFLFNPVSHMGTAITKGAVASLPDAKKFFQEAGFGTLGVGTDAGPTDDERERSGDRIKEPVGVVGTAFKALKKLFFLESSILPDGVLLIEQDEKGAEDKSEAGFDANTAAASALDSMGVLDWAQDQTKSMIDDAKKSNEEFFEQFNKNMEAATALSEVDSYEALQDALKSAKENELDLAASIEGLDKNIQEQVDKLLNDQKSRESFIRAIAEKEGKAIPEDEPIPDEFLNTPDDQLRDEAMNVMFTTSTETLREKAEEAKKTIAEKTREEYEIFKKELFEDYGIDEEAEKTIRGTPVGREFMGIFDESLQKLESAA